MSCQTRVGPTVHHKYSTLVDVAKIGVRRRVRIHEHAISQVGRIRRDRFRRRDAPAAGGDITSIGGRRRRR